MGKPILLIQLKCVSLQHFVGAQDPRLPTDTKTNNILLYRSYIKTSEIRKLSLKSVGN